MTTNLIVTGVTYPFPTNDDVEWGYDVTNWATGVTNAISDLARPEFTNTSLTSTVTTPASSFTFIPATLSFNPTVNTTIIDCTIKFTIGQTYPLDNNVAQIRFVNRMRKDGITDVTFTAVVNTSAVAGGTTRYASIAIPFKRKFTTTIGIANTYDIETDVYFENSSGLPQSTAYSLSIGGAMQATNYKT